MGKKTLRCVGEEAAVEDEGGEDSNDGVEVPAFGAGDIVAVVEEESTPRQPKIILGKILRMEGNEREVLLAHLEPASSTEDGQETFRLVVGRSTWRESYDAVVYPIDVQYRPESRTYVLRTDPLAIHSVILG